MAEEERLDFELMYCLMIIDIKNGDLELSLPEAMRRVSYDVNLSLQASWVVQLIQTL